MRRKAILRVTVAPFTQAAQGHHLSRVKGRFGSAIGQFAEPISG